MCSSLFAGSVAGEGFCVTGRCEDASNILDLPSDVQRFLNQRAECDHFRSEPRDFDVGYKEKFGKDAEDAERKRAEFLEKKTNEFCAGMDKRLVSLKRKYRGNEHVIKILARYPYIEIFSYSNISFNRYFPNIESIQKRLREIGFWEKPVWFGEPGSPTRMVILVGKNVQVATAQRIIEVCLELSPKDIGVSFDTKGINAYRVQIGGYYSGENQLYVGDEIQQILNLDLMQEEFEKLAEGKRSNSVPKK